jgi:secreted PhoX family phosphatase
MRSRTHPVLAALVVVLATVRCDLQLDVDAGPICDPVAAPVPLVPGVVVPLADAGFVDAGTVDGGVPVVVPEDITFTTSPVPIEACAMRTVQSTPQVTIDDVTYDVSYRVFMRSGDGGGPGAPSFGTVVDESGASIALPSGAPFVSSKIDLTTLHPRSNAIYTVSHVEEVPGGLYLTTLLPDALDTSLVFVDTRPIDLSAMHGLWKPCAGSTTPTGSHMGAEEFPPDARAFEAAMLPADLSNDTRGMLRYFGFDVADPKLTLDDVRARFSPYRYGFVFEATVSDDGNAQVTRHHAMGRVSGEAAHVMPDERTVYITDDATKGVLLMFVADLPRDYSSGHLYAARWNQTSSAGAGAATLDWIALGHADDATIVSAIDDGVQFSDLFVAAQPTDTALGLCPADTASVHVDGGLECLRVKDGMQTIASRLETKRLAALLGATTEFRKEEGLAFDAKTRTLYVAMTAIDRGMRASTTWDIGGLDHVQLDENPCGAVYRLALAPDAEIGSDWVAHTMEGAVVGTPTTYPADSPFAGNICDVDGIAGPDNLAFIAGAGILLIAEDTGSKKNAAYFAFDVDDGTLTRLLTAPLGAEVTGAHVSHDGRGFRWLMAVMQHPMAGVAGATVDEKRAIVGAIGPLP